MIRFYGLTHKGFVREANEDTFFITTPENHCKKEKGFLFVVADGVGGHDLGAIAGKTAVKVFASRYLSSAKPTIRAMEEALLYAHKSVVYEGKKRGVSMGTTLTALVVSNSRGYVCHVGDSRLYLLKAGKLYQVTDDHVLNTGSSSPQHVLTQAVGINIIDPSLIEFPIEEGSRLLLSTDGLHGYVKHVEIERLLKNTSPIDAAEKLIEATLATGGNDNVTVIVVDI